MADQEIGAPGRASRRVGVVVEAVRRWIALSEGAGDAH